MFYHSNLPTWTNDGVMFSISIWFHLCSVWSPAADISSNKQRSLETTTAITVLVCIYGVLSSLCSTPTGCKYWQSTSSTITFKPTHILVTSCWVLQYMKVLWSWNRWFYSIDLPLILFYWQLVQLSNSGKNNSYTCPDQLILLPPLSHYFCEEQNISIY